MIAKEFSIKPTVRTAAGVAIGATLVSVMSILFYTSRSIGIFNSFLMWCRGTIDFITNASPLVSFVWLALMTMIIISVFRGTRTLLRHFLAYRDLMKIVQKDTSLIEIRIKNIVSNLNIEEDRFVLIETEKVDAFVFGVFRPHIFISTAIIALMDDAELEALLTHEMHHMQNHDPLKKFLFTLVEEILFFLPSLKDMRKLFFLQQELSADRVAMNNIGGRRNLAGAMIKIVEQNQKQEQNNALASYFHPTQQRLQHITSSDANFEITMPLSTVRFIVSGMMLFGILSFSIFSPITPVFAERGSNQTSCENTVHDSFGNQSFPSDIASSGAMNASYIPETSFWK